MTRWLRIAALCASLVLQASGHAQAAEPPCVTPGSAPRAMQITAVGIDDVAASLDMPGWGDGQQLAILDVHRLTGGCRDRVLGFSGNELYLRGNLLARWTDAGELGVVTAASSQPSAPAIPEANHDDHSHGATELGEFLMGAQVAVGPATRGGNEYFVGVWRAKPVATVAVYARTRDGIFSGAAPLLRSRLPLRAVSYLAGPDPQGGEIGLTQEAGDALYLIRLRWRHRDYTQ